LKTIVSLCPHLRGYNGEIQVNEDGTTIQLSGVVNSFYHKQLAQEVVRKSRPEKRIINSLKVP